MQTTLCFDFGNTRLKCAVFHNRTLSTVLVLDNDDTGTIAQLLQTHRPAFTLLSSVVNHNPEIETLLAQQSHFHKLDHTSKLPVTTPVGKPETIGADRLGLVSAATDLFPNQHNLVIGLGSCITYNFVNRFHQFLGGAISPGMEMRLKAMHDYTAKLPLVKAEWNFPLVGYDTKTNMLSGTILGMCKEIDGMIEAYEERYNNLNVLLTGGDMQFFTPHLRKKITADAGLMYKGLYAISEANR
ncbi:type III pantothenate kinase [Deminuibacter soli]|uniref:Type III pantothenate kinase n=1 Tax=Deminuibacter soli TaxID=2291815 RepID=A0A3E1NR88_9BACT|nr:type III pantothenate kinase [Deminuibacter soli]RFM30456.1 type III pantothenate kinase [Deminuibacter soli]